MGASILAFPHRKPTARDWTNEELAELYRVVDILGRAGVEVEIETGLSDEGDPWLIICRVETGDVLAHFARIDGQFIAASPTLDATFRGANFRQIVDQLARSQPLMVPPPSQTGGTRLFMHPSVVLTAFVATALLQLQQAEADAGMAPSVPAAIDLPDGAETADQAAAAASGKAPLAQALQMMFRGAPAAAQEDRSGAANADKAAAQTVSLASVIAIAMSFVQHDARTVVADEADVAEASESGVEEETSTAKPAESVGDGAAVEHAAMPESGGSPDRPLDTDVPAGEARAADGGGYAVADGHPLKLEWAIFSADLTPDTIRPDDMGEGAGDGVPKGAAGAEPGQLTAALVGAAPADVAGDDRSGGGSSSASTGGNGASGSEAADADSADGSKGGTAANGTTSVSADSQDGADGASSGTTTSTATVPEILRTDLGVLSVEDLSDEAYSLVLSGVRGTMSWWFAGDEGETREAARNDAAAAAETAPPVVTPLDAEPEAPAPAAAESPEAEEPQLFHTIAEFVFSERNTITAALQPSQDLVDALDDYIEQNGNAPIRLVVFSSEDLGSEIFPFVPGVLFVERSHVGNKDLAQLADLPQTESGIALVGVIDVDAGLTA